MRMRAGLKPERRDWYRMQAATPDAPAEVMIYDEIGWYGVTAADFVNDLKAIDGDAITVRLNSPGGDVYDGIAILNALRGHKAKITTVVDGLAASAASFIAMAGDEIVMGRNSELMIHDAWGYAIGNAAEVRKIADDLDRASDNIASIYADRAGGTAEEWRAVMRTETWYSAQEAVDAGLADRVVQPPAEDDDDTEAKASFDLSIFNYAGRSKAPAPLRPANRADSRTSRASTNPDETTAGTTPEGGSSMALTLSDEQETSVREALGLAEDADATAIVDAILEIATAPEPEAEPAALADGTVVVEAAMLEALQASARRGDEARTRQESDDRAALVENAIRTGRVAPARRDHWLAQLAADPGVAETLASLAPVYPVGQPLGHDGVPQSTDDDVYTSLFPKDA